MIIFFAGHLRDNNTVDQRCFVTMNNSAFVETESQSTWKEVQNAFRSSSPIIFPLISSNNLMLEWRIKMVVVDKRHLLARVRHLDDIARGSSSLASAMGPYISRIDSILSRKIECVHPSRLDISAPFLWSMAGRRCT